MGKITKRIIVFLLLISGISTNFSCVLDRADNKLRLFNNTQKDFYLNLKKDTVLLLKDVEYMDEKSKFNVVRAKDTCVPLFVLKSQGGYIRKINKECLDSTMFLYLFEMDSVKKYGWLSVIHNKNLYVRKGFKVKDLDSLNWVIEILE